MKTLTDSQKKAHDFLRHLSVTANAGSGKTTVLVNRFVDILLYTDTRVNELVAITFTDKAASELKKKIADAVEERMQTTTNPEKKFRLEEIRSRLSFANIGTIHSFCAKLLREYPVEAQVDAGFTVLEEVDQELLEYEAIRESFEALLNESQTYLSAREALLFAVRALGRNTVHNYLNFLLRKREQVERMMGEQGIFSPSMTDASVLSTWKGNLNEYLEPLINDGRWREAVKKALALAPYEKAAKLMTRLGDWEDSLLFQSKIEIYSSVMQEILTHEGKLNRKFFGRTQDFSSVSEEERFLGAHAKAVTTVLPDHLDSIDADHRMLLQLTHALLMLYQHARDRYDAKKGESGAVDFEDLLLRTRLLLQNPSIREQLGQNFKYIMVDEYQDTNRLQYEILQPLILDYRSGNLFIVGDPKQSIYGFRNADVEVFDATKHDIVRHAAELLPFRWEDREIKSDIEEKKGCVVLADSFRLLTNIILFVNCVFSRLMSRRTKGSLRANHQEENFEVEYEELVRGRLNNAPGNVELLLVKDEGKPSEENSDDEIFDTVGAECEMIARRILSLYQSKYAVYEEDNSGKEHARSFEFRDAAILLRSRRHLPVLEKAMVDNGIPYLISSGIGFYQTQEIFDFLNYLKFLLNPHDDVALAGILRSPFFAVSDAELFEIATFKNDGDFWLKLIACAESSQPLSSIKKAKEILADNLQLANRMPIPFLVQRIFHQTGWIGAIGGMQRGAQCLANIQKLLRIAREFEGRGFSSLFDFVERLKILVEEQEREGQASLDTGENCVHIMTIHAAKGLEFRIVFVPFCDKSFRYDNPPYLDPKIGLGIKVVADDNFNEEVEPPIYRLLKERARQKKIAEEKRIFYVACTRARDMLVLSGTLKENNHGDSFLDWTLDQLGLDPSMIRDQTVTIHNQQIKVLEVVNGHYEARQLVRALDIRVFTSLESIPFEKESTKTTIRPIDIGELFVEPLQAQTYGEFFSATQIKTYLECPTKYFLKYRLGLPEQNRRLHDFDENEDANDKILGEQLGVLVHRVLQSIDQPTIDGNELRARIDHALQSIILESEGQKNILAQVDFMSTHREVFQHVRNFIDSEFGQYVLASKEFFTEYTINTAFGDDYLTGTLDGLYKEPNGMWALIDYKTDSVRPENLVERAEYYRPQLAFYALLVRRLFSQLSVHASLVFTAHPGKPFHFDFDEAKMQSFEKAIQEAISRIKAGDFARPHEMCSSCTYQRNGSCLISSR